jgi:hypothetical protein
MLSPIRTETDLVPRTQTVTNVKRDLLSKLSRHVQDEEPTAGENVPDAIN